MDAPFSAAADPFGSISLFSQLAECSLVIFSDVQTARGYTNAVDVTCGHGMSTGVSSRSLIIYESRSELHARRNFKSC